MSSEGATAVTGGVLGPDTGRVAIVTGAAGAIGATYARALAGAGYRLVLADVVDASALVSKIGGGTGATATAITTLTDVSDPASTREMAATALEVFGRIDVLVNNAAHFSAIEKRPFEEIEPEEWDRAFAVNVRGSWLCACAVTPEMRARRAGKIVNTSSTSYRAATPGFAHYAASKAAIVGLTRSLARELGEHNIQVNTITPDYIPHGGTLFAGQPGYAERLAEQRCLKRPTSADDLVGTLLFLAGPGSDFVTGQDFTVDGGRVFG